MGTRHLYWILIGPSLAVHSSIMSSVSTPRPNVNFKYSVVDPDPHWFWPAGSGSGSGSSWDKVNPQKEKNIRNIFFSSVWCFSFEGLRLKHLLTTLLTTATNPGVYDGVSWANLCAYVLTICFLITKYSVEHKFWGSGYAWILIVLGSWIRIRIVIRIRVKSWIWILILIIVKSGIRICGGSQWSRGRSISRFTHKTSGFKTSGYNTSGDPQHWNKHTVGP